MKTDERPLMATFIFNADTKIISVTIDGFVTALGPFNDEEEAAVAAHAFCAEQATLAETASEYGSTFSEENQLTSSH